MTDRFLQCVEFFSDNPSDVFDVERVQDGL